MIGAGDYNGESRSGAAGGNRTRSEIELAISGLTDDIPQVARAVFYRSIEQAWTQLADSVGRWDISFEVEPKSLSKSAGSGGGSNSPSGQSSGLRAQFPVFEPTRSAADMLVLSADVKDLLFTAVDSIRLRQLVFGEWGLDSIEPHPSAAISLNGPPGTGKSLAAMAVAYYLNCKVLQVGAADLESRYFGDGAKNVRAVFEDAQHLGAIVFIDEADSLLSSRIGSALQGAEHAVNSMRSELIEALDRFEGVAIFATNLIESYDNAIHSRLWNVPFAYPDYDARMQIWRNHLPAKLPISKDVSIETLARRELSGREIKQAVILAATRARRQERPTVDAGQLEAAISANCDMRRTEVSPQL